MRLFLPVDFRPEGVILDRRVVVVRDRHLRHRLRRRVRVLRRRRRLERRSLRRGGGDGGDPLVQLLRDRHVLLLKAAVP